MLPQSTVPQHKITPRQRSKPARCCEGSHLPPGRAATPTGPGGACGQRRSSPRLSSSSSSSRAPEATPRPTSRLHRPHSLIPGSSDRGLPWWMRQRRLCPVPGVPCRMSPAWGGRSLLGAPCGSGGSPLPGVPCWVPPAQQGHITRH